MIKWSCLKPRSWQKEAYEKWKSAGYKGTIEAGTGSGKTYLGIMALYQNPTEKDLLVVVPTQHLMYQWKEEIRKAGYTGDIGLVGDGHKDFMVVTIAVVNSIRQEDLARFGLVVLDECHRYMSACNKLFLRNNEFDAVLGLTATIKRTDNNHLAYLNHYPIVYRIGQKECIDKGWLCKYKVINKPCMLIDGEAERYQNHDGFIRRNWRSYSTMAGVQTAIRRGDFTAVQLLRAVNSRRKILNNSATKILATANLLIQDQDTKTIVFGEYKNAANKLYKILKRHKIDCAIYHSGIALKKRRQMLEDFRTDKFKVMISVKALDEGLDVPAVQRAIIMGGSSVERQMIQRLGRVLRAEPGKLAVVIQLYIPDTKDQEWVEKRTRPFNGIAESIEWGTKTFKYKL